MMKKIVELQTAGQITEMEGKVMSELIKQKLKENNIVLTKSINNAIFIFPNGDMIDGCYMNGDERTQEHGTAIDCFVGDISEKNFWNKAHFKYELIRLVPETGVALIKSKQTITSIQKEILAKTDYTIEEY